MEARNMRLLALLTLIIAMPAYAQDQAAQAPTAPPQPQTEIEPRKLDTPNYSPDYCQFTVTFPTEPYMTQKCDDPNDANTCFNLISYTQVFDLDTTVRFEIICNPANPAMYDQFSEKVMEDTVAAMVKDTVIETYNISSQQQEKYRHTGLVGLARKGLDESLLITQLWVADKSIMSVQAEISGVQRDDADQLFADVLNTIGFEQDIKAAQEAQKSAPPSP